MRLRPSIRIDTLSALIEGRIVDEIWKSVPSKPEILVSSFGRIQLPSRMAQMPHGGWREYNPKPTFGFRTKASKNARHVYMGMYNKFFGNMKIHRLVCEAFHGPAPIGKPVVLHLDENAENNRPENLRWGTQKENLNAAGFIEYCKGRTGVNSPHAKGVKSAKIKHHNQESANAPSPQNP
jgi:HNH endonuclease